jgi:serine protease Do
LDNSWFLGYEHDSLWHRNRNYQKINVILQESNLSEQYRQGIARYEGKRYRQALEIFRQITELNQKFPYVQEFISSSRQEIDKGNDRSIPIWAYGAVPGTLVGGGLLAWWMKRRSITLSPSQPAISNNARDLSTQTHNGRF